MGHGLREGDCGKGPQQNWSVMGGVRMGRSSAEGRDYLDCRPAGRGLGWSGSGLEAGSAGRNLKGGVCSKFSRKGLGRVGLEGGAMSSRGGAWVCGRGFAGGALGGASAHTLK